MRGEAGYIRTVVDEWRCADNPRFRTYPAARGCSNVDHQPTPQPGTSTKLTRLGNVNRRLNICSSQRTPRSANPRLAGAIGQASKKKPRIGMRTRTPLQGVAIGSSAASQTESSWRRWQGGYSAMYRRAALPACLERVIKQFAAIIYRSEAFRPIFGYSQADRSRVQGKGSMKTMP